MSAAIDAAIYIFLIISIGFAGIGVIGLLLFPDIRSRMYTAFRATVISFSAIILSGTYLCAFHVQFRRWRSVCYPDPSLSCSPVHSNGINSVLYKMILNRSKSSVTCREPQERNKDKNE